MASGAEVVVAAVEGHCRARFMACKLIMVLCLFFSDRLVYVLVSLSFSLLFVVSFVMCTNVFFFFLFPGELLARVPMADRRQRKEDGVSVRLAYGVSAARGCWRVGWRFCKRSSFHGVALWWIWIT